MVLITVYSILIIFFLVVVIRLALLVKESNKLDYEQRMYELRSQIKMKPIESLKSEGLNIKDCDLAHAELMEADLKGFNFNPTEADLSGKKLN